MSTFEEFLVTRGEGVHSLFATVLDGGEFRRLREWLTIQNVTLAQSYRLGDAEYAYFDMSKTLANFFVQVVVPDDDSWETSLPIDEQWDFSDMQLRPDGINAAANAQGITHFGVVVEPGRTAPGLREALRPAGVARDEVAHGARIARRSDE
jgi:hypothetical protein